MKPTDGDSPSTGTNSTPIASPAATSTGRRGSRVTSRSVLSDDTRNTTDPTASSEPTTASSTSYIWM